MKYTPHGKFVKKISEIREQIHLCKDMLDWAVDNGHTQAIITSSRLLGKLEYIFEDVLKEREMEIEKETLKVDTDTQYGAVKLAPETSYREEIL
jgi:hypothetical protein